MVFSAHFKKILPIGKNLHKTKKNLHILTGR